MKTLRSIMSLREGLRTGSFDLVRLSTMATDTQHMDDVLAFAEDQVSRMNDFKKALDALPDRPGQDELAAFHEAVLGAFVRESDV